MKKLNLYRLISSLFISSLTPLQAQILISDGAERSASDDRIEGLSATVSGSTVTVNVDWVADNSGSYTSADGIHLKVFYNSTGNNGAWTEVYSRIYHHDANRLNDGFVQGTRAMNTVHRDTFTFTASGSGTQYVRAAIIDRASNSDTMTGFYASGSSGTASGTSRHFDNWDVSFSMGCTTPGTPGSLSASPTGATTASLSWSAGSPVGSPTVTYSWQVSNTANTVVQSGSTTATSATATGLSQGTTYTFRVMATTSCNNTSSSWSSNSSSFTTWTTPSVTTTESPINLAARSVTLSGNVTQTGGTSVTARGIAWGTSSNPTSGTAASSAGTGSFSVNVSGLAPNTRYYYRAYATNSVGTSYGTQYTFDTPKDTQTGVGGSLAAGSIQYGLTTTVTGSGGQSTGAYQFRRSGGDNCVSFAVSGNPRTITGTSVGSTTIQVRRLGDNTYLDSDWVSVGTLTVTPAPLTVTADNKSKVYGAADPALTFTASGTLYHDDTYNVISGVSLSTQTGANATAGTHTITASGGTATNYTITHVNGTLTVSQRPLTGSFTVENPKVYDDTTSAHVISRSLTNLATWDTEGSNGVFLAGGEANYDTKAVGTDKEVTLTGMTLSGDRSANYVLETMNTTTADIVPDEPAEIIIVIQPGETVAGQKVEGPPEVEVRDQWANPVLAGIRVKVGPESIFTEESTLEVDTDANGRAVFDDLVIEEAGQGYQIFFQTIELIR